jgi:hypothetical protein
MPSAQTVGDPNYCEEEKDRGNQIKLWSQRDCLIGRSIESPQLSGEQWNVMALTKKRRTL